MEKNGLIPQTVYEQTTIGGKSVGRSLYLGNAPGRGKINTLTLTLWNKDKMPELWQFPLYTTDAENRGEKLNYYADSNRGSLNIFEAVKRRISPEEKNYLEDRLKKAGINP